MNWFKTNLKSAIYSSFYFVILLFIYSLITEEHFSFGVLYLLFVFIFAFPIYFVIANPLTFLVSILLKKYISGTLYMLSLLVVMMLFSFIFLYGVSIVTESGVKITSLKQLLLFILFNFITAISAITGIRNSQN